MNSIRGSILFDKTRIAERVRELAAEISRDYEGKDLVIVAILKGAFMFLADLSRHISVGHVIDFARLASYGSGTESRGVAEIRMDMEIPVRGRDVLIVEDIIDTGITIAFFAERLKGRTPRSLRSCTLIDKKERRETEFQADYVGFSVRNGFVVGYGLDYDEQYRCLPDIYLLDETAIPGGDP
ncbi:MAG: hypoxanthine phosphoribosyltransferase [Syntrophales bacterium]|nr:hypoxanthine phosphoribosyltransferase [Syntrophales bacterium]MCK9528486.1 hypoxanthine phosphoribosyltransferase [Syntrophales bacterium]MDX9923023.1 hypoxanthine phosphoribosyltransferase [Syntrophales bacterium]